MSDSEHIADFARRLGEESWQSEPTGISLDVSHQLVVHPALAELRREERNGLVVFEVEMAG